MDGSRAPGEIPISGHLWTIVPQILGPRRPPDLDVAGRWSTRLLDPTTGEIELRGLFDPNQGDTDTVVIVVHGLGGSAEFPYMHRAVAAARAQGWASLRLNLRGAERGGHDYYHAGLHVDIRAAIDSPQIARYSRVFLFGYSLGGHVSMHLALDPPPTLAGVAAICSPLDLARSVKQLDSPGSFIYRRHVLTGAKDIYCRPLAKHPKPTPIEQVRRARSWRAFDEMVIVPRWGFESPEDYYTTQSVGQHLHRLERPTLLVHSKHDPMVPPWTWQHMVEHANDRLTLRTVDTGGHVAFPSQVDFNLIPEGHVTPGLEAQVMRWFERSTS